MDRKHAGLGLRGQGVLRLSSDEALAREKAKEAERTAYRRQYWQKYAKRVRRVFGALSPQQFDAAKERAEAHGRSVWGQIWAESEAYRNGGRVSNQTIESQQRQLIGELRRIGNNFNQLAKLGHLRAKTGGGFRAPGGTWERPQGADAKARQRKDDDIGAETLRQMQALEAAILRLSDPGPSDDR